MEILWKGNNCCKIREGENMFEGVGSGKVPKYLKGRKPMTPKFFYCLGGVTKYGLGYQKEDS